MRLGRSLAVALGCAGAATFPFFAGQYQLGLAVTTGLFVLSGMGLNLIAGFTGQLSFGQAAFFGGGAYACGILLTAKHWAFVPALLAAVAFAAVCALVVGGLALRLQGVFFAIATLAAAEVLGLVANNWQSVTHGANGIVGVPRPSFSVGTLSLAVSSQRGFYGLVAVAIAIVFVATVAANRSAIGRAMAATRESEELAEAVGVNTLAIKLVAFILSGAIAGLAGALYSTYISVVSPDLLGSYYSAAPLLILLLGGRKRVAGPLVGGILLIWVPALFHIVGPTRLIVLGVALIVVTLLAPGGVLGALSDFGSSIARLKRNEAALAQAADSSDAIRLGRSE